MKFVEVTEDFETYVPEKGTTLLRVKGNINIDTIELIRVTEDGLSVFLIGRDKALKITDRDSVNAILKECKIKTLNE